MTIEELKALDDKPPLLAEALKEQPEFEAACKEVGLDPDAAEASPYGLWLAVVAHRAGLGLPGDPLRVRGWIRFGRPLMPDVETPQLGDVMVSEAEQVLGIWLSRAKKTTEILSIEGVERIENAAILTHRRPIVPSAEEGEALEASKSAESGSPGSSTPKQPSN